VIYQSILLSVLVCSFCSACAQPTSSPPAQDNETLPDNIYTHGLPTSADGTGKFYQGRDIAQVMGHQGADWLERSGREEEERTDLLIEALNLQPDDVVADIGAGSGYFTFRISPRVPQGKVLAVDIQPEMLAMIRKKQRDAGGNNVQTILGTVDSPRLPTDSVDWVLLVDAYHEFSHPYEMMRNVADALAPGGRVALVEYREEDPNVPIKPRHKMTEAQAVREMNAIGLTLLENKDVLPQQHLMIFGRQEHD
jgi:ubiquinone/menaquinone biosynthesis C-methylase UbiE